MKQTFTTYDLITILSELKKQIIGARVNNVYDVNNKTYLLKLSSTLNEEKYVLLLESGSRFHLTDYEWPKNIMPSGFSMKLRKHIRNKKLSAISQVGMDRIIDIQFGFEEASHHLLVELYDKGNMVLTDSTYTILHLLRPRTDANQNIKYAAHEKYPLDLVRKLPDCLQNLSDCLSINHIENYVLPLLKNCKGPWSVGEQNSELFLPNKVLASEFAFGTVVIEHCLRLIQKNLPKYDVRKSDFISESESMSLMHLYAHQFAIAIRDLLLKAYLMDECTPHGYIFGKKQAAVDEVLISQNEFQPCIFEQYQQKSWISFDTFNKAVDAYFSRIESQKTNEQVLQKERKATKKLENMKEDHERRLMALKNEQELNVHKAQLLETNRHLVDSLILMINHALSNQLDWTDIKLMVDEAKSRHDQLAMHIVTLNLQSNQILIRLSNPYEEVYEPNKNSCDEDVGDDNNDRVENKQETQEKYEKEKTIEKTDKMSHSIPNKTKFTDVMVDLDMNALNNARKYYDKKRAALLKQEKTLSATSKAMKSAARKAELTRRGAKTISQIKEIRKSMWFEKFHWFISSENYLIIGGRDSQQNEVLVKRYLKPGDIFVHADVHGASTVIVKSRKLQPDELNESQSSVTLNLDSVPLPPPKTLLEAGNMAVVLSSAWDSHVLTGAWWVRHDQVSKTAPSGEYLTTGAFMIRGRKNYLPPCQFDYGFGILFKLHEDSLAKHKGERRIINLDNVVTESSLGIDSTDTKLDYDDAYSEDQAKPKFPDVTLKLDLAKNPNPYSNQELDSQTSIYVPSEIEMKKKRNIRQNKSVQKCSDKLSTDHIKNEQPLTNDNSNQKIIVKRGQKSKIKKIKQKYKEQDEEERQIRMKILQGDDAKPSQYHQIIDGDCEKNLNKTLLNKCSIKDDNYELFLSNDEEEQNIPSKQNSITSSNSEKDNLSNKSVGELDNLEIDIHDEHDELEQFDLSQQNDFINLLDSLTGQPNNDDLLLYAIPVCAPYTSLMKYKFRVKLNPGTTKRGRASKMAVHQFITDKLATSREKDLMRAMRDEEVSRNFPGCVKVALPHGKKFGKQ